VRSLTALDSKFLVSILLFLTVLIAGGCSQDASIVLPASSRSGATGSATATVAGLANCLDNSPSPQLLPICSEQMAIITGVHAD